MDNIAVKKTGRDRIDFKKFFLEFFGMDAAGGLLMSRPSNLLQLDEF